MKSLKVTLIAASLALTAGVAQVNAKSEITVKIPKTDMGSDITTRYECGDFKLTARYITEGQISIVTLKWPDNYTIASQVVSGSGARYVSGPFIWWENGDEAKLINTFSDDDDNPAICAARK